MNRSKDTRLPLPAYRVGKYTKGSRFICPECGHGQSAVVDTRPAADGVVSRRRCCLGCNLRFRTFEITARKANFLTTVLSDLGEVNARLEDLAESLTHLRAKFLFVKRIYNDHDRAGKTSSKGTPPCL